MLFLNNAINHGVFTPLGTAEAVEKGKSILFLIEANPGPGLGLLLAFTLFGKGLAKASAPGAALIQFVGGIHEIYFPYVLMKPFTLIAASSAVARPAWPPTCSSTPDCELQPHRARSSRCGSRLQPAASSASRCR